MNQKKVKYFPWIEIASLSCENKRLYKAEF